MASFSSTRDDKLLTPYSIMFTLSPQQGFALLMMLMLLLMGALLLAPLTPARLQAEREQLTATSLARAKEALIAYAVSYGDKHPNKVPGYLPCPETATPATPADEGSAESSCAAKNISVIGKFPWKTLGLGPLRDGYGECLWYAVSGSHKNNPPTEMMNWDTTGWLSILSPDGAGFIVGDSPDNRAAAVIFAPGAVTGSQNRSAVANAAVCGGNYNPGNYLEASGAANNAVVSAVANALSVFISAGFDNGVNDRYLAITPQEIFAAIEKRSDFSATIGSFTGKVGNCIAAYGSRNAGGSGDKRLPWPAPIALADYLANASYDDDIDRLSGRLPYRVNNSKTRTANGMTGTNLVIGVNCPGPWSALDDEWYKNWKDHLFYALGGAFGPGAATPSICPSCLSANGIGSYAAIVLFAGKKLAGQKRISLADKAAISNYLEDRNSANDPNAGGNSDYRNSPATAGLNDLLYCIDSGLSVAPCP